jgi:F-type H+-transporting ATPase subunit delta
LINLNVARRYAKAALTLGKDDGRYQEYGDELKGFAALLKREPELKDALLNPIYGKDDRHKLLLHLIKTLKFSPVTGNLLKVMFDKHRLEMTEGVSQVYAEMVDEMENLSRARVKAAVTLDEATQDRLRQALEKLTGTKVVMEVEKDPKILGGIVARVGDLVLDGSVRTQLLNLRESLIKGEVL